MTSRIIAFSKSSPLPPQSLLWVDFGLALVALGTICILHSRTNLHVCIGDWVSPFTIDNLVQQYAAQNLVYLLVLAPLHAIRLGPLILWPFQTEPRTLEIARGFPIDCLQFPSHCPTRQYARPRPDGLPRSLPRGQAGVHTFRTEAATYA